MCFVHKPMQNADFGQILCQRASTKRHLTSRPTVRFSQTWYQKMRKTWKKKGMKRRVTICGGREAVADFVQGGSNWPPPPVKIGLKCTWQYFRIHPKSLLRNFSSPSPSSSSFCILFHHPNRIRILLHNIHISPPWPPSLSPTRQFHPEHLSPMHPISLLCTSPNHLSLSSLTLSRISHPASVTPKTSASSILPSPTLLLALFYGIANVKHMVPFLL